MAEPSRGLLDTSVVIDLGVVDPDRLPDESAIAAVTLAELAAGRTPPATNRSGRGAWTGCNGLRRHGMRWRSIRTPRECMAAYSPPCEGQDGPVEPDSPTC